MTPEETADIVERVVDLLIHRLDQRAGVIKEKESYRRIQEAFAFRVRRDQVPRPAEVLDCDQMNELEVNKPKRTYKRAPGRVGKGQDRMVYVDGKGPMTAAQAVEVYGGHLHGFIGSLAPSQQRRDGTHRYRGHVIRDAGEVHV